MGLEFGNIRKATPRKWSEVEAIRGNQRQSEATYVKPLPVSGLR